MNYDAIALKIVPPSCHRSVLDMRRDIAAALKTHVEAALHAQQEKAFPELAVLRKELEAHRRNLDQEAEAVKKRHREKQEELDRLERILRDRQKLLDEAWQRLAVVQAAFWNYAAWIEGDGEVDENGRRFNALRDALKAFRETKK